MTITEAVEYVQRMQNEEGATQGNWSTAELYQLFYAKSCEAAEKGIIEGIDTSLTTVAAQADYTIPSSMIRVRRVWVDGLPMKYLDFRRRESRMPTGVAPSGDPREFALFANTITLLPTPSTSSLQITLYGEKVQSAITSTSSTLEVPALFHYALCDGVLAEMFSKDLNAQMASKYEQRWYQVHLPKMEKYAKQRRRVGLPTSVIDADSNLETEFGVV